MQIRCPHCGLRDRSEFNYGGDANVKRPEGAQSDDSAAWYDYVYLRDNPCGEHHELWHHTSGCRAWFSAVRDTKTHIFSEQEAS